MCFSLHSAGSICSPLFSQLGHCAPLFLQLGQYARILHHSISLLYKMIKVVSQPSSQQDATRELSKSTFFINCLKLQQRYSNITENGVNPPACTQCNRHLPLCLSLQSFLLTVLKSLSD